MFTVKCDGQWLYNPQLNYQLINPKLTLADCAAGSFEFTMDKTHPLYDKVYEITSRVYVYRNGALIWEGRPIKEKDDWYGNRSVTCEGALAYLNDTIQEQAEYHDNSVRTWLTTLINKHNAKVDASRQFKIGTITVEENLYRYTNYETTLDAINDKLISRLGGHLRVRRSGNYNYIDYLKDYPYSSTQKIEFGRNLLDFSKSYNLENIVTAILPLGARLEDSAIEALEAYTDISSVATDGTWHTKNTPYIQNKSAVDSFGWVCKVVRWDDVTEPTNLYTKAKKYLTEFQYNELDLEIKAIDFNFVDSQIEALNILDRVQVISKPHGLDKLFPISKMEITLNNIADTTLTLGATGYLDDGTMTSKNNSAVSSLLKRIEEIPSEAYLLEEAKAIATDLITSGALGSYVIVRPEEIIVTNNLNYTARTAHVWRWNKNGLGYSSTGYNGTFGLAMTADGAIVADMITAGTMRAERIKGGILTLGGKSNVNGVVKMYDVSGSLIGEWSNAGLTVLRGTIQGPNIILGGKDNKDGSIKIYDSTGKTVIGQWNSNGLSINKGTITGSTISGTTIYASRWEKAITSIMTAVLELQNKTRVINGTKYYATWTLFPSVNGTDYAADGISIEMASDFYNFITSQKGLTIEGATYNYSTERKAIVYLGCNLSSYTTGGADRHDGNQYMRFGENLRGSTYKPSFIDIMLPDTNNRLSIDHSYMDIISNEVHIASEYGYQYTWGRNGEIYLHGSVYFVEAKQGTAMYDLKTTNTGLVLHVYSGSSRRVKHDIADVTAEELNPELLYEIPVKQFVFNDDILPEGDERSGKTVIGLIAEDVDDVYPMAADHDEDGQPYNWNHRYLIPPMLALIQDQKKQIDVLEERVSRLEKIVQEALNG